MAVGANAKELFGAEEIFIELWSSGVWLSPIIIIVDDSNYGSTLRSFRTNDNRECERRGNWWFSVVFIFIATTFMLSYRTSRGAHESGGTRERNANPSQSLERACKL